MILHVWFNSICHDVLDHFPSFSFHFPFTFKCFSSLYMPVNMTPLKYHRATFKVTFVLVTKAFQTRYSVSRFPIRHPVVPSRLYIQKVTLTSQHLSPCVFEGSGWFGRAMTDHLTNNANKGPWRVSFNFMHETIVGHEEAMRTVIL